MLMKAVTARTFGRLSAAMATATKKRARAAFLIRRLYHWVEKRRLLQSWFGEGPAGRAPACYRLGRPGRPLRAVSARRASAGDRRLRRAFRALGLAPLPLPHRNLRGGRPLLRRSAVPGPPPAGRAAAHRRHLPR